MTGPGPLHSVGRALVKCSGKALRSTSSARTLRILRILRRPAPLFTFRSTWRTANRCETLRIWCAVRLHLPKIRSASQREESAAGRRRCLRFAGFATFAAIARTCAKHTAPIRSANVGTNDARLIVVSPASRVSRLWRAHAPLSPALHLPGSGWPRLACPSCECRPALR
jgi:hypothetical protein